MKVFKTTFHFDEDVHTDALAYVKSTYVKNAIKDGILYDPQLTQVLVDFKEQGSSYVLQFRVKDRATLTDWLNETGGALQEDLHQKFGEKVCSFSVLKRKIALD